MAELSNSYIKGFVETCFKAGMHEKQAAALLDIAASNMEKRAAGPSFWRGVGQLFTGAGNVIGGAGKAVFGGGGTVLKPIGKGIRWVNDKAMVQPVKHYVDTKNYGAAIMHMLGVGAVPPAAGLLAFQNWRDKSDSKFADTINDYLGTPEFGVFGGGGGGIDYDSTATYTRSTPSSSSTSNASPMNIPGTVEYSPAAGVSAMTPGEKALAGTAASGGALVLPESVRSLVDERKDIEQSLKALERRDSTSPSATVRARRGRSAARDELLSRQAELDAQIETLLNDHNRQVAINNSKLKDSQAAAEHALEHAKRRDTHQSQVGYNNPDASWWQRLANDGLELIGIRDDDVKALQREEELRQLTRKKEQLDKVQPEKELDVARAIRDIKGVEETPSK